MKLAVALLLGLSYAGFASAECAPSRTVRIETQDISENLPAGNFERAPRVLYRLGNGRTRVEERPNRDTGLHLLLIVNAPDAWTINLNTMSGEHAVDSDVPSSVRVPIFSDAGLPSEISDVEFGCELDFIAGSVATHERVETKSGAGFKHSIRAGRWKLTLATRDTAKVPLVAILLLDDQVVRTIRYLSYEVLESVPSGLFEPPAGITIKRDDQSSTSTQ